MKEVTVISSEQEPFGSYLGRVWQYRNLILVFAKRELKIKYAQTFFGIFWIVLQPIPTVAIFTFFFDMLIRVETGVLPYPVFALIGMAGWNYFSALTNTVGNSLHESSHLLKKINFPKIILPLSKVVVGAVDFGISFLLVAVALIYFSVIPAWTLIFLPFFFLLNIITGFVVGIWIAALSFRYKDILHIAPAIINFCIWLTPVFYPVTILPEKYGNLMFINPMAFVINGYRFCLSGTNAPDISYLISVIPIALLFLIGLWYFRKVEDSIADYI